MALAPQKLHKKTTTRETPIARHSFCKNIKPKNLDNPR